MIKFDWYETEPTGGLHFHMSDFTQRLIIFETKAKGNSKMAVAYKP